MKHFFSFLGLFILSNLFGQDFKKFEYQFDIGTTLTIPYNKMIEIRIEGHPKTYYRADFGYFSEFLVSYNFNSKFSIGSGLNYSYSVVNFHDKFELVEYKGKMAVSYFNIPILFKYKFSKKLPISVSAGSYLGFLVNAREKGTSYIDTSQLVFEPDQVVHQIEPVQDYNTDIKSVFKSIEYGLSLQFDYEIILSKGLIGIILTRFNYELINALTNDRFSNYSTFDWKNYNLVFGLGLKIE